MNKQIVAWMLVMTLLQVSSVWADPIREDRGRVEMGRSLDQEDTASGAQNFMMQGNLAVAAAMAALLRSDPFPVVVVPLTEGNPVPGPIFIPWVPDHDPYPDPEPAADSFPVVVVPLTEGEPVLGPIYIPRDYMPPLEEGNQAVADAALAFVTPFEMPIVPVNPIDHPFHPGPEADDCIPNIQDDGGPLVPIPDQAPLPVGPNDVPPPIVIVAGPDPIPDPTVVVAVVTQPALRPTEEEPIEVPLNDDDIPTLDTTFFDTAISDIKRLGDQMRSGIISGQAAFDRLIEIEGALYDALMEYEKQGGDINDLADLIAAYQFRRSLIPGDLANGGGGGVYPSGSTGGSTAGSPKTTL